MKTGTKTPAQTTDGRDYLISCILEDIKTLWDAEGFGSDEAISEPLYQRLNAAIRILNTSQKD